MAGKIKLEIVCGNIESVIAAQEGGADRVELCENLTEGGTTPSYGMIRMAREKLSIALHIMIRPRGGDFLYSADEFEIMKRDIEICKQLKVDGVVFGMLNDDGSINKKRTKELVSFSQPMHVTFHRAFDMSNDSMKSLEDIIECGCSRILTSGQKATAVEGALKISELIKQANGRIMIMAGGGIRPSNAAELISKTNAMEIHSSAKSFLESAMKFRSVNVKMGQSDADDYKISSVDVQTIKDLKAIINAM